MKIETIEKTDKNGNTYYLVYLVTGVDRAYLCTVRRHRYTCNAYRLLKAKDKSES